MLNKVQLIGHLGRDPELKTTPSGTPVCRLSLATDEGYTDRNGNRVARTEWHYVTVWGKNGENCEKYLTKGSMIYVEGSLTTRKWQDKSGEQRQMTEVRAQRVVFLDAKHSDTGPQRASGSTQNDFMGNYPASDNFDAPTPFDDVPF